MMIKSVVVGTSVMALLLCSGCRGEGESTTPTSVAASYEGPIASTDVQAGADVYATFCEGCHPGGAAGDGPAVYGIAWPAPTMRKQVREGEDAMPGFGPDKISDEALESLLAHLATQNAVAP